MADDTEGAVGITTIDLSTPGELFTRGTEIPSFELLFKHKLPDPVEKPRHERYAIAPELSELDLLLGVTVQRFAPEHGLVYGRVSALRGAAVISVGEQNLFVTDLVEVTFDEWRREPGPTSFEPGQAYANPKLEGADSGALVTTWDGRVIGLLIAGTDHAAFVVPLHAFLERNSLVHQSVIPDPGIGPSEMHDEEGWVAFRREVARSQAAVTSNRADLAREYSLGLPALGVKAA